MSWTWVDNLLSNQKEKKQYFWDARCPYMLCPSNTPYRGCHAARLKYVQKVSPMVHQYKCKDCGCLTNFSLEAVEDIKGGNPVLFGGRPDYKFHV